MENNNPEPNPENQNISNDPPTPPPTGGDVIQPGTSVGSATPDPIAQPPDDNKPEVLGVVPPNKPKKKSKKSLIIVLVLLLLALAGAAAWWLNKNAKTPEQTKTIQETQPIEILKVGSVEGPASVLFPDEGVVGVQNILDRQIYEGLVRLENNKIVPTIAKSWTNPDDTTWIFKLNDNVKFQTGKPVTAKEVKAALEDLKKYDYWSTFVSTIDTIEATGDLEVTIKTKTPDALLLNRLVLAYIIDVDAADKVGNNGTGAYQLDATATNDEKSTTLVAFDDYYAGKPKTRKLVYVIYNSDEELIKAYKNKEIDILESVPTEANKKELASAEGGILNYESPGVWGLYLNHERSSKTIMKNKDFRTGLAQALDRQTVVNETGGNNVPATQVIPKSLPGYDESVSFPKFDLTAAKASIVKSGYKNEPIEYVYVKDIQLEPPLIIAQLREAGINVVEVAFDADDTDAAFERVQEGEFDIFSAGYTSDISDARDILGRLLHTTERNYPTYSDTAFDKLLADSDTAFDPTERIKILQQASKYIADNVAWVPFRNSTYIAYHPKDVDIVLEFNGGSSVGVYFRKVGRIVE